MASPLDLAREFEPELIALRRDLHRHPEVAWEEARTGQKVADYCEAAGLAVRRRVAKTGVLATLNPDSKGPVLALRADMDALPIEEENDTEYRSTRPGVAHLCGHDVHTAMLMGTAKILARYKKEIGFPVRFIFQPAEEVPKGGATEMIAEGALEQAGAIFGLHVSPLLQTGCLGLRAGPMMASMDSVEINVEGLGGHGAMPNRCLDPVLTSAEIILALQSIVSRRMDPLESAVLSITQVSAGTAFNIIPSRARLIGTARSLSNKVREKLPQWIEEIACGVARAHGLKARMDYVHGTTVLVNDAAATEEIGAAFKALGGRPSEIQPTMGGEDFSYYLEKVPGAFGFLGVCDGSPATAQSLHNPHFDVDEKALAWGVATFLQVVFKRAGINI